MFERHIPIHLAPLAKTLGANIMLTDDEGSSWLARKWENGKGFDLCLKLIDKMMRK